ncbi:helix-hairpin-helix domain-containing protein [Clostridium sp. BL-8]|uniref:helix-hairpin-helix domain-containing protein n=1 Tax=Clostridium sp. BL-8 TaxID=349938 RepID=UPI00098C5311|nr:helix-hairpin-helix domain-containing protein [Clostridium sp. BL-8]OOM68194.1 helix-hairpin-helix motif protein [Clostridium sp. BL-8]
MKKYVFILIFALCIMSFAITENACAKEMTTETQNIIVLKGTDETKDGFPVYELMDDDKLFMDIYNKSFIKKSVELYGKALQYSNLDSKDIYFAFRENSGCYGNIGFYLKKDGQLYDKTKSPYIELSTGQLKNYNALESITQILPHEMGHVIQKITTSNNGEINQNVVDMHYSNIQTEYSTAFCEGFGEHFEVISRMYEENNEIKNGIYKEIEGIKNSTKSIVNSASRDFTLPLRLDYYREVSQFWQQKYENLKRHELGLNGDCKYKNLSYDFMDPEKSILYRNMGLYQDKTKMKSLEQSLSTEIVVSNFFIKLITTDTGELNERYSKVFNVFNKYLNKDSKPQLIEFVNGYIREYPQEKERILQIFKDSTGHDFTEECAPEIWCISEGEHSNIIFDQFRGLKFPYYIFNINTCEKEDLLRLKGISKSDTEGIIAYRDKNNGFKSTEEFSHIEGVSGKAIEILTNNTNKEQIEKITSTMNESKFEKSFSTIFIANFKHLISRTIMWFVIFFITYYLFAMKASFKSKKSIVIAAIKKFFKLALYVLIGFMAVAVSSIIVIGNKTLNPIIIFIAVIFIYEGITLLVIRKDKLKVRDSIISTLMIIPIIIYSQY